MTYERVVSAAVAETASKFKLAEALALDIPPQRRGPKIEDEQAVPAYLEEARQAIIAAGGEPREVKTLNLYRCTALWVSSDVGRNFRWVTGRSFSTHLEAYSAGMTYEQFTAMPKATVNMIRQQSGQRPTWARKPDEVMQTWTPEEKAKAARDLISDPDVADEVMQQPETRSHAAEALDRFHTKRDHQEHADFTRGRPEPDPDPFRLLYDFRRLHRTVEEIARQVSQRGTIVSHEERDLLLEEVDWLASAISMIRDGIRGGDLDTAISRILAEGGVA